MPHFDEAGREQWVCQRGGHICTGPSTWIERGSEQAKAYGCHGNVCPACLAAGPIEPKVVEVTAAEHAATELYEDILETGCCIAVPHMRQYPGWFCYATTATTADKNKWIAPSTVATLFWINHDEGRAVPFFGKDGSVTDPTRSAACDRIA